MLPDRPLPGAVHGQPGHWCTWGCPGTTGMCLNCAHPAHSGGECGAIIIFSDGPPGEFSESCRCMTQTVTGRTEPGRSLIDRLDAYEPAALPWPTLPGPDPRPYGLPPVIMYLDTDDMEAHGWQRYVTPTGPAWALSAPPLPWWRRWLLRLSARRAWRRAERSGWTQLGATTDDDEPEEQ